MAMQFYASPEQIMRDRSEYARKGISRGRSAVVLTLRRRRAVRRREPVHRAAQGQRDLRPDRVRRGRALQRVREPALGRRAHGRPARATRYDRRDVTGAGAGQRVRADPRRDLHRADQAVRGGDLRRRGRARRRPTTSCTGSPTTARCRTSRATWRWAARPRRSPTCSRPAHRDDLTLAEALALAVKALGSVGGEGGAPREIGARPARGGGARPAPARPGVPADHRRRADRAARGGKDVPEKEVGEAGDEALPGRARTSRPFPPHRPTWRVRRRRPRAWRVTVTRPAMR